MLSSAGEVRVSRIYLKCVRCADGGDPADDRLGIDGRHSAGTQRLASLAAASWSYGISRERLEELCGLCMTDHTIREIAQKHGAAMNGWQTSAPQACREFREADGELEFTTDGTSVNTKEGWREMKAAIFLKRPEGEEATSVCRYVQQTMESLLENSRNLKTTIRYCTRVVRPPTLAGRADRKSRIIRLVSLGGLIDGDFNVVILVQWAKL